MDVSKVEERRKLGWVGTYHACTPSLSQKGLSRSRNTPVKLVYVSSSPLIQNCISWRADFSLHVKNVHRVIRSALPQTGFLSPTLQKAQSHSRSASELSLQKSNQQQQTPPQPCDSLNAPSAPILWKLPAHLTPMAGLSAHLFLNRLTLKATWHVWKSRQKKKLDRRHERTGEKKNKKMGNLEQSNLLLSICVMFSHTAPASTQAERSDRALLNGNGAKSVTQRSAASPFPISPALHLHTA